MQLRSPHRAVPPTTATPISTQPTPAVPAQKAAGASIAGFALTGREKVEQDNANDIVTAILGYIPTLIFDIILLPSFG
ncbi:hypothetical protein LC593_01890 [Nostoc sp. CHAB 5844]|nr:hypothetical protein [Nostoc sp. CHAB 5844]